MDLILKDGTKFSDVTLSENKMGSRWVLTALLKANCSSTDIDTIFSEENTSYIKATTEEYEKKFEGYKLNTAQINYEVQLPQIRIQMIQKE